MEWILGTKPFSRWMRKTLLTDSVLLEAVDEMKRGLIDADLGGGVFKKRIALPGKGKRGGARTIIATNRGDRWFFMFGFEKNNMENISDKDLKRFRLLAAKYLNSSEKELLEAIDANELKEIHHGQDAG